MIEIAILYPCLLQKKPQKNPSAIVVCGTWLERNKMKYIMIWTVTNTTTTKKTRQRKKKGSLAMMSAHVFNIYIMVSGYYGIILFFTRLAPQSVLRWYLVDGLSVGCCQVKLRKTWPWTIECNVFTECHAPLILKTSSVDLKKNVDAL